MSECAVCLAAEFASDESKERLLRLQAVKLDQMRSELLPLQVALGMARDRIRELEETIERQNRRLASRRAS